jgi:hypothetical protein
MYVLWKREREITLLQNPEAADVFIYPGVDRSGLLTCLGIACVLEYDQLAHQTQVASVCENISENEIKESESLLTEKASVNFSQVSFL